jgi:Mg2+/Co2+ transporter CorB
VEKTPVFLLVIILILLVVLSAFFSAAETGLMALNRYRLRHLVRQRDKQALRVAKLLDKVDRLLGTILIGNTFANIFAASIATIIAVRIWGNFAVALMSVVLALVVLVFAEVLPKTLAAIYPQRTAFAVSWMLSVILKLLYPLAVAVNFIVNNSLRLFHVPVKKSDIEHLTSDELITLLQEAGSYIPQYQKMLLAVLDLENITVNDVMVSRHDVVGIDLEQDWTSIVNQVTNTQYTRLPVYAGDINNAKGFLHARLALRLLAEHRLNPRNISEAAEEIYFIPEETELNKVLLAMRTHKKRAALVVDEYGEVIGLVTLEDILEEIVGEFTTTIGSHFSMISRQADGSYLVGGGMSVRDLNREMNWNFDSSGPKTLSGLIIEQLEAIPAVGTTLMLSNYRVEIVQVMENRIILVKITPQS